MAWLQRWDRHNQGMTNWLGDHPEAGTRSFPRARSTRARWLLVAVASAWLLSIWLGGLVLGVPVGIVFLVLAWRLQVHPGRDRYGLTPDLEPKRERGQSAER